MRIVIHIIDLFKQVPLTMILSGEQRRKIQYLQRPSSINTVVQACEEFNNSNSSPTNNTVLKFSITFSNTRIINSLIFHPLQNIMKIHYVFTFKELEITLMIQRPHGIFCFNQHPLLYIIHLNSHNSASVSMSKI